MRESGRGGLGLCSTLVVIFVVLKMTDLITWSWIWVFSPWWILFALAAVAGMVALLGMVFMLPFEIGKSRKKFNRDVEKVMGHK